MPFVKIGNKVEESPDDFTNTISEETPEEIGDIVIRVLQILRSYPLERIEITKDKI